MALKSVDAARCPECGERITGDDDVGFLQTSESSNGSSGLVVCPHCDRVLGAAASASYDSILF
ncbi:hypothetical protein [Halogeometricum luteum]|uniref:Small CPxCG-related zinc finger protein n=1 Tax=Halogeometricum luteum TaxID=2950537 RepID=A0ABU2G335_9EURY|nr:hypothetical protein [Halogeometricum sp. S3BR5-2]MDS0295201.1 hypothetical protein [Halogeometricum sp. S3BR5-2]